MANKTCQNEEYTLHLDEAVQQQPNDMNDKEIMG